jgi:hypothetical protein
MKRTLFSFAGWIILADIIVAVFLAKYFLGFL